MSEAVEKLGSGREGPIAPRRRWSDAEKRRIVAESYQPGVSVSVVARRNDVNANLVFTWRRQFREQAGGAGGLVPVVVEPAGTPPPLADAAAGAAPATGRIEIALADGSRVIVDREVDGSALARVLAVLEAAMIPCVDAPVDASIFRTAWCMRSGAVVCPASRLRRFTGRRACMEIRGSGPYRFRELERSTGSAWFSRPGLVDRLPLPVLRPAHIPDGSRVSLPVQAAAGAR